MLYRLNNNKIMNLKSKNLKEIVIRYIFLFRLWQHVTSAIKQNDQILATEEKTNIEHEQRKQIKERQITGIEWHPHLFRIDPNTKQWIYIHDE